ncbi:MAG: hypothetical protein VB095_04765 [Anaerovorax sp.]|nr:hypothetical protein [Anaerovorax sp.]
MSDQYTNCEKMIRQLLEVQAQITVKPLVEYGKPNVYCVDSSITPNPDCCNCDCNSSVDNCYDCDCNYCDCDCYDWGSNYNAVWESERSRHQCNYTLTQVICVEIPIYIEADVEIDEGIVCCDSPEIESL